MPTVLSRFSESEIFTRWKTPYVSDAVNSRLAAVVPAGVYRGFRVAPSGSALRITLLADAEAQDHVLVYETHTGYSLTLRKTGNLDLDLSPYAGSTIHIAVVTDYANDRATAASILASPVTADSELDPDAVILATVQVPGSGTIPASAIDLTLRRSAWMSASRETAPWLPVLRNGTFEAATLGAITAGTPYWEATAPRWTVQQTDAYSGKKHIEYVCGTGAGSDALLQTVMLPVTAGQLVRISVAFKALQRISAGSLQIIAGYADHTGADAGTISYSIATPTVDAAYRMIERVVAAPTGAAFLKSVRLAANGLAFAGAGPAFRVGQLQAWLEAAEPGTASQTVGKALVIEDLLGIFSDLAAVFTFDHTTGQVALQRRDAAAGQIAPALALARAVLPGGFTLHTDPALLYTLASEFRAGGGAASRLYASTAGSLVITSNAKFQPAGTWIKDVSGTPAFQLLVATDAAWIRSRAAASDAAWPDDQWVAAFKIDYATRNVSVLGGALTAEGELRLDGGSGTAVLTRAQLSDLLILRSRGLAVTPAGLPLHTHAASKIWATSGTVQATASGAQAQLDAHAAQTAAHAASRVSLQPTGGVIGADAQTEVENLRAKAGGSARETTYSAHIHGSGAHRASAIEIQPITGLPSATLDAQTALNEVQAAINTIRDDASLLNHRLNQTGAHKATAISVTNLGFTASNVQTALIGLKSRFDGHGHNYAIPGHNHDGAYAVPGHTHRLDPLIVASGYFAADGTLDPSTARCAPGFSFDAASTKVAAVSTAFGTRQIYTVALSTTPTDQGYAVYIPSVQAIGTADRWAVSYGPATSTTVQFQIVNESNASANCEFYFTLLALGGVDTPVPSQNKTMTLSKSGDAVGACTADLTAYFSDSNVVTVTAAGVEGASPTGLTMLWTYVSGDWHTTILPHNGAASVYWRAPSVEPESYVQAVWKCTCNAPGYDTASIMVAVTHYNTGKLQKELILNGSFADLGAYWEPVNSVAFTGGVARLTAYDTLDCIRQAVTLPVAANVTFSLNATGGQFYRYVRIGYSPNSGEVLNSALVPSITWVHPEVGGAWLLPALPAGTYHVTVGVGVDPNNAWGLWSDVDNVSFLAKITHAAPIEHIVNGSFASGGVGWTHVSGPAPTYSGGQCVLSPNDYTVLRQVVTVSPAADVGFSAALNNESVEVKIGTSPGTSNVFYRAETGGYAEMIHHVLPNLSGTYYVEFRMLNGTLDDVSFKAAY